MGGGALPPLRWGISFSFFHCKNAAFFSSCAVEWSLRAQSGSACLVGCERAASRMGRRNVLFVTIDDLRPQLAHLRTLGDEDVEFMHTPNLDSFVRQDAVSFSRAHVQIAVCSPSRTSVLFGRRPDTTGIYNLVDPPRAGRCKRCESLPQKLRRAGFTTVGVGKLWHTEV